MIVDEPKGAYYGGVVAAPIAKSVFTEIFKHEDYLKSEPAQVETFKLDTMIGLTLTEAASTLSALGIQYLVQGDGDFVTGQIPAPGTEVKKGDIVLLSFD